eukprot:CAMPEP_0173332156 /NCGR_PEP_ID=MMETSP1144-20121109/4206_1 /TAXON_ID=483371 /ORGANISM="non described non described, Strain CCMP2298" /LENGTH=334 /DNA_ID=CAMNT_0014277029 /DNA_START=80 /DNA_END=1081 /DNA_ORIENTATION=+
MKLECPPSGMVLVLLTICTRVCSLSVNRSTRIGTRLSATSDSSASASYSSDPDTGDSSFSPAPPAFAFRDKQIVFVRHGKTEMNERMDEMPWFHSKFLDAALWDTRLSQKGLSHSKEVHSQLANYGDVLYNLHQVQALLASPLTRTLQTAEIVFGHQRQLLPLGIPRISHPLLRERLYLSSDVGRSRSELSGDYPDWDFSALPEGSWWYTHPDALRRSFDAYVSTTRRVRRLKDGTVDGVEIDLLREFVAEVSAGVTGGVAQTGSDGGPSDPYVEWRPAGQYCTEGEPKEVFVQRMRELKAWLAGRPEDCIAVVAHWGVLKALTGREFQNCEVR